MEIDQFIAFIREIEADPNKYDMNKVLYDFQHQINANVFYQISQNNNLLEIFKSIWNFLIAASGSPSSNTRVAACKSIGTFLSWIAPFYPELIRNSFVDVVCSMEANTKNSAVIASSFAFISSFVAEPFLPEFLKSIPIFQHFVLNDATFSEHVAVVLSKLKHLGSEWLKSLLNLFLKQIEDNQDRILIRKIASIVGNDPTLYFQIVLDFIKPQIHKYMPLLTFLITTYQKEISSTIDFTQVAAAAIDTISDDKSNLGDFDSALQILSIKSDSFNFSVTENNETNCTLKITNDSGLEKQATIDLKKVISMPSFYMLKLPLNLLKPNPEKDSILVLGSKFKSIASNTSFDINEVFTIFEPFLQNGYNDISSSAIQAFALCINRVISGIPHDKFHPIIRKILFSKPINWYHSFDILKVINNIDSQLFTKKMGEKCFIELLECLINFCLCENESLANDSMKSLADQTYLNRRNLEKVIAIVISKCDFFELLKLDRCVSTITSILAKFSFSNHQSENLTFFSEKLIEAIPMYWSNVNFLCHVFNFFSLFKIDHGKRRVVINAAYCTIFSTIEIISGRTVAYKIKIDNSEYFKELIKNDLSSGSLDIIAEPGNDHKAFIYPMKCALFFIFGNAPKREAIATAMISHRLFPLECSEFYEKNWDDGMDESDKTEILSNLLSILKFVSDERVHSTWCRICVKNDRPSRIAESQVFSEIVQFLVKMASYFLTSFEPDHSGIGPDASVASSYIEFVSKEGENSEKIISDFLEKIDKNSLRMIVKKFPRISEIVPSIHSKIGEVTDTEIQKTEDQQSDEQNEQPTTKVSDDVSDDQLRHFFEEAIRNSNVNFLKEVIETMTKRKMTIKLEEFKVEFPPETIPIVAKFLANHLTSNDQEIDLLRTLRGTRTLWRPYSIEIFKKPSNANKLLDFLIVSEKVKKNDILCLSTMVGEVEFDNGLLFKLSMKLLFESTKFSRFRVTLKLLTTVLSIQTTIPSSFLSALVTTLSPIIEKVDTEGISIALLIVAQKVGFPQELVKFARDLIPYAGYKSNAHGRIIQIFVGVSSSFPTVGQKINDIFPELTVSYLKSFLPSQFNLGCRLLEQATLSIKSASIGPFLGRGIELIVNRYNAIKKLSSSITASARTICAFVTRSGINQQQVTLFRSMNKMSVSSSDACFATFVGVLLTILKKSPNNIEIMRKFPDSFFDSIFYCSGYNNGNSFKYARLCLLERLKCISSMIDREKLITKTIAAWCTSLQNYRQVEQVKEWWNVIMCHFSIEKALSIFDSLLTSVIKIAGFNAAFPAILSIFVSNRERCKNMKEFQLLLENVQKSLSKKCHIEAFEKMMKLPEKVDDKEKLKELVKLAFSENE